MFMILFGRKFAIRKTLQENKIENKMREISYFLGMFDRK